MLEKGGQLKRWLPYAVLVAVVCLVSLLPPTNDAAWQLWIGRRLAGGARLYSDIVEINPPLWFWLAVPVVKMSDILGVSAFSGLVAFLGASAALSIALVQRLRPGLWISLSLIFAFFATGLSATGQREQFSLIAVTPYVFLAAARADGGALSRWIAVAIGLYAATGIALKPHFALVPLALEAWLLAKRGWSPRPEFIALALAGVLYAVALLIIAPDYRDLMVPLIGEAYGDWDVPLRQLVGGEVMAISLTALIGLVLYRKRSNTVRSLTIAATAFLLAFMLQRKGFRYHGLPAIGLFSIMAIVAIVELRSIRDLRAWAAAIALGAVPLQAVATTAYWFSKPSPVRRLLCDLPRGSTALVLTPSGNVAWPAVEVCDLNWASRYMFLWMLPAIGRDPGRHAALASTVRQAIVEDIARYQPDLIVIERGPNNRNADAYAFAMADAEFRAQLTRYTVDKSSTDRFAVFRREAGQ